ncbi:T9SS type A sorting domain-containing protein [Flavobacterium suncheonense]|uniref:LTD domain-containing protein n=1 Tax=Flavobacterium suncheonense GH29-5 = DSM 17707 TaxID=1121899 RepID=A0A0A2MQC0_9FLAO|nr:T9SS type A sorting domain-containing protein [Flavobacterium suncheonense]KGO90475.1 hypothetical protein Q764_02675 [Flavobacterium suncheonense GH29-5 = DSM 17707]
MKKIYSLLLLVVFGLTTQAQVVISQVYGGGGNTGAQYKNDFIEIFNRGAAPQNLNGWSVQYASATGGSWTVGALPNIDLQPGQYLLIQGQGGANGADLPASDATIAINLSGTNGKVVLANTTTRMNDIYTTPPGSLNPVGPEIVDKVGFGTANGNETASMVALSNTTAGFRLNNGCTDTDNNAADFIAAAPSPRNTATALSVCSSAPSILITSPANGTTFSPETTNVNVVLSISNFNVANGTGDGHIHYTINGGATVMKYDTTPIAVPTTPGSYTVFVQLVDNSHNPIVPAQNATVTFTVAAYTPVANLAALRADVIANGIGKYYQIASNPVVTYTRTANNQKYVQDATAAILIHDPNPAVITTPMVIGDAISGLKGKSENFNGTLELLPTTNATVASSGNTVTPQIVTAATISANIEAYESELVQINNATFTTADGSITFASGQNYNLNDGTDIVFRTLFSEADYIGEIIPQGAANRVVLVSDFNGTAQVVSRSINDVTLGTTSFNNISGLNVYPNPANDFLHITTAINGVKTIAVYDVMGKEVLNTTTANETINVSSLNAGIYMVKITEEGKTATRKLVIK